MGVPFSNAARDKATGGLLSGGSSYTVTTASGGVREQKVGVGNPVVGATTSEGWKLTGYSASGTPIWQKGDAAIATNEIPANETVGIAIDNRPSVSPTTVSELPTKGGSNPTDFVTASGNRYSPGAVVGLQKQYQERNAAQGFYRWNRQPLQIVESDKDDITATEAVGLIRTYGEEKGLQKIYSKSKESVAIEKQIQKESNMSFGKDEKVYNVMSVNDYDVSSKSNRVDGGIDINNSNTQVSKQKVFGIYREATAEEKRGLKHERGWADFVNKLNKDNENYYQNLNKNAQEGYQQFSVTKAQASLGTKYDELFNKNILITPKKALYNIPIAYDVVGGVKDWGKLVLIDYPVWAGALSTVKFVTDTAVSGGKNVYDIKYAFENKPVRTASTIIAAFKAPGIVKGSEQKIRTDINPLEYPEFKEIRENAKVNNPEKVAEFDASVQGWGATRSLNRQAQEPYLEPFTFSNMEAFNKAESEVLDIELAKNPNVKYFKGSGGVSIWADLSKNFPAQDADIVVKERTVPIPIMKATYEGGVEFEFSKNKIDLGNSISKKLNNIIGTDYKVEPGRNVNINKPEGKGHFIQLLGDDKVSFARKPVRTVNDVWIDEPVTATGRQIKANMQRGLGRPEEANKDLSRLKSEFNSLKNIYAEEFRPVFFPRRKERGSQLIDRSIEFLNKGSSNIKPLGITQVLTAPVTTQSFSNLGYNANKVLFRQLGKSSKAQMFIINKDKASKYEYEMPAQKKGLPKIKEYSTREKTTGYYNPVIKDYGKDLLKKAEYNYPIMKSDYPKYSTYPKKTNPYPVDKMLQPKDYKAKYPTESYPSPSQYKNPNYPDKTVYKTISRVNQPLTRTPIKKIPPTKIFFKFESSSKNKDRTNKIFTKKNKVKTGYEPSVEALLFDISGVKPSAASIRTGIFLRPKLRGS